MRVFVTMLAESSRGVGNGGGEGGHENTMLFCIEGIEGLSSTNNASKVTITLRDMETYATAAAICISIKEAVVGWASPWYSAVLDPALSAKIRL